MSQLEKVLVSPIGKFSQRFPIEESLIWPHSQALIPQDAQLWAGSSLEEHGLSLNVVADPEGATAGGCQLTALLLAGCLLKQTRVFHLHDFNSPPTTLCRHISSYTFKRRSSMGLVSLFP